MSVRNWTREEFEQKIVDDWVEYFGSSPEEFAKSGSSYVKREQYAPNRVIVAHVGSRTFIQYSPNTEDRILAFAEQCPVDLAVTADHMVSYFENENVRIECLDDLFYLYPASLKLYAPGAGFTVRKLLAEDGTYLDELNGSCSEEEVDNSFVAIDELGAWGCFAAGKLVAAAAFSDWGLYGDFGVITHPEFRRQGLAKAVVSVACREAVEVGKVPIYRCHITLFSSINTARSVGFVKYPRAYSRMEVLRFAAGPVEPVE